MPLPKGSNRGALLRNAGHFLIANGLGFVLGMATSIALARSLGPQDLGIFHQVLWFSGMVSVLLSFGLNTTMTRFSASYRASNNNRATQILLKKLMWIEFIIGGIATLGLLAVSSAIADHYFTPKQANLFMIAFVASVPGLQTSLFVSALEGMQIFKYQSLHSMTVTPASLAVKIGLLVMGFGLEAQLWCNLLFAMVNLGFYAWAARKENIWVPNSHDNNADNKGSFIDPEVWKFQKSMSGIHIVDLLVWSRTENYFLGRYCQAPQIAFYNLAANLVGRLTGILPALMWKLLLPFTSDLHGRGEIQRAHLAYQDALRYTAVCLFPVIALLMVGSYECIIIFYGHEYAEAKLPFRILCLASALSSLSQPGAAAIYAEGRHHFVLRFGVVLAIINITLNFWLIPKYGALGAAISYGFTTSSAVIGGGIYNHIVMGYKAPWATFGRAFLASIPAGIILFLVLQIDLSGWDIFSKWRSWNENHFGFDADILLGARTIRLLCGVFFGLLGYSLCAFLLMRLTIRDQNMVKRILDRFPKYFSAPFQRIFNLREVKHEPRLG